MEQTAIKAPPEKQEIIVTRRYNAPRELVFKALTDPTLIPEWWGPRTLTTKVEKMELKWGGPFRFIQKDPEGKSYIFHGVYHTVKSPEQLVYTMEWDGMPDHVMLNIDRFDEQDRMTTWTSRSIFETIEDRDGMLQGGMEDGVRDMTKRVDELLAKKNNHERMEVKMDQKGNPEGCITITRVFDAPREKIWDQWTDAGKYMCWSGAKDFTTPYAKLDARVGGKFLICMHGPDGKDTWGTGTYEEVDRLNRIVYSDTFADEHGNIVPASYYGMGEDKPLDMEVIVTFEDSGGRTRMTMEQCGLPEGEMLDQSREGWNQSFDKLAACLK